jgi:hypothetical protein
MAGHTPGPWVVESVCSPALHDICLGYRVPGAGHPVLLASAYCDEPGRERPGDIAPRQADANARLMAAAPDLLAALKKMRATMYSNKSEESILADAAIAKAEGG